MDMQNTFQPRPINPLDILYHGNDKDSMLIEGLREGAYAAGARGEDVEMAVESGLKRLGRYDLLPPCCRN